MITGALIRLRERFHPLHRLRQSPLIAKRVLPMFDRPVFIRMHGVNWPVRVWRMRHMSYVVDNRIVEPGIAALFLCLQALRRPHIFWDVGANAGFYSWLLMSQDDALHAVLFEPDSDNLRLLHDTIAESNLADRAEIVAMAASDSSGEARFVVDRESGFTSHLAEGGAGADGDVTAVQTTTLDAELGTRPAPQLIKIDVEGAEDLVVAGASRLIGEVRPVILLECFGGLDAPALQRLAGAGYEFLCADDIDMPVGSGSNYLCLPPDCDIDRAALAGQVREARARWTSGAPA